jgi:dTMP kinase
MKTSIKRALFITFEGGEGSGKSLQARALYRKLNRLSIPAILIHEPGSTPLGEKLSRLLKQRRNTVISPESELLLFNAARAELVNEIVLPSLKNGQIVVCDRYTDSTLAYQGYGRGLKLAIVQAANDLATGKLKPELTLLLDIPVREGLERKRRSDNDRFESEEIAFHERVRKGYLSIACKEPQRFMIIDARQDKRTISQKIWKRVSDMLSTQKK